ncbi:unnamed protein product, partial [Gulo gulo]
VLGLTGRGRSGAPGPEEAAGPAADEEEPVELGGQEQRGAQVDVGRDGEGHGEQRQAGVPPVGPVQAPLTWMRILPRQTKGVLTSAISKQPRKKSPLPCRHTCGGEGGTSLASPWTPSLLFSGATFGDAQLGKFEHLCSLYSREVPYPTNHPAGVGGGGLCTFCYRQGNRDQESCNNGSQAPWLGISSLGQGIPDPLSAWG